MAFKVCNEQSSSQPLVPDSESLSTAVLRKALKQLEVDRMRLERQIAAIRTVLDSSSKSRRRAAHRTRVASTQQRRRRRMSAAARKAFGQRMKAYWAARRKAAAAKTRKATKTSQK